MTPEDLTSTSENVKNVKNLHSDMKVIERLTTEDNEKVLLYYVNDELGVMKFCDGKMEFERLDSTEQS